jgi:hypothetical protein
VSGLNWNYTAAVGGQLDASQTAPGTVGPAQIAEHWMAEHPELGQTEAVERCMAETGVGAHIARRSWARSRQ